jgi:hypothetical protein
VLTGINPILNGDPRPYGNLILRKGVVNAYEPEGAAR